MTFPQTWSERHGVAIWAAAIFLGPAVAGLLTLARPTLQDNHATLILVLVVAVVSASGVRTAGVAAAFTCALAYNYFWTEPYGSLAIFDVSDIITVVLLFVVAATSGQLSWWAARQHADAACQRSYLHAVQLAAETSSGGATPAGSTEAVCSALTAVLDADRCRLVSGEPSGATRLSADGSVKQGDRDVDVDRWGLPTDDVITVLMGGSRGDTAHFEVSAASHVARPSLEQRQIAALIARLAGAGLPSSR